ncbi:IPT/TIG domain-containing protein [Couchioplanes azureus]|uniref:IPT/TIG domain-containing protein n=1 Tax=Couchioplanes caeruleus TaxID=56438 RepID=UPI00166FB6E3|nr:IPT/TIG domain-containing protein [Couchioplanes caeruleus]GGQ56372.1 hypothetical protein GCM10010166_27310 [Couchioplanes caeruleus subsp. azureus]
MRLTTRALHRGWLMVAAAVLAAAPATIAPAPASAAPRGGKLPHAVGGLVTSPTRTPARVRDGAHALDVLPASVDLRRYAPPPGDQGQVGACVAWTIGYSIMGYYANRTGGSGAPYAPLFLYLRNVVRGGAPSAGLYPDSVLANVKSAGIDTQADYWQGTTDWRIAPTTTQIENAKNYRVSGYRLLFNGANQGAAAQESIKQALATGSPVALGIPVYQDFMNLRSHSVYSTTSGTNLGNHMIAAYGYDSQGVLIRNSWGQSWGNGGDAKLSWAFITRQAMTGFSVDGIATPAGPPVAAAPTVTALSVARGPAGTSVTIRGTGLSGATSVRFGDRTATFEERTTLGVTTLVAVTPALAAGGLVDVRVTSAAGTSAVSKVSKFTFVPPPPAVTSLNPASLLVFGGATITLTGTDLTGATSVMVGTTKVAAKSVTPTSLTFAAPAKSAGTYPVAVTNTFGSTSSVTGQLTYQNPPPPTVSAVAPASGLTYKTTPVVLTGTDFTGATGVTVDGVPARFTRVSATQLKVSIPAHAAGTVTVRVTTPGGTSEGGGTFRYVAPPPPVITSLSVINASTARPTAVTITGTGLTDATSVLLGTTSLRFTRVSDSQVRVTVPARPAGAATLRLTTPGGTDSASISFAAVAQLSVGR